MRFPTKKNASCPKALRDFPPRKDGILYPRRVVLGLPSPSRRVCADGRTDVRTDSHVTITSQPKFLGFIGYQISLAMELRRRALPAGSGIIVFLGWKLKLETISRGNKYFFWSIFVSMPEGARRSSDLYCPIRKNYELVQKNERECFQV